MVSIKHTPCDTLVDENVQIKITGLTDDEQYTLRSYTFDDRGNMFECCALYRANIKGKIDLCTDASRGGFYRGVEPMGLFWAMKESKLNFETRIRLSKENTETPLVVNIQIYKGWLELDDLRNINPLEEIQINRWYKSPGVKRIPIKNCSTKGTLFIPEGTGPFKGVVDMFGGAGGLFEFRASMLATRGFLTLALGIFDIDGLPSSLDNKIDLNYFEEAVELLRNHPLCVKSGVGVVGVSLGSAIAFAMAAYVPGVHCCVCINSAFYMEGFGFTYKGLRKPGIDYDGTKLTFDEETGFDTIDCRKIPTNYKTLHPALLECYKSDTKILFLAGEADRHFPMTNIVDSFKKLQEQFYVEKGRWETKVYPGAGHLLELPNTPLAKSVYFKMINSYFHYGGETVGHAKAQEDSWRTILGFLNDNIKLKSKI